MDEGQVGNFLTIALVILGCFLAFLVVIYIILLLKTKKKEKKQESRTDFSNKQETDNKKEKSKDKNIEIVNIQDFMEFETVEDNMIVQKENYKYIMVVECQGVNYDLMSGIEKNGVEEGFVQFLNTLKHPIQIYIQTRTINLEGSLTTYRTKVNRIQAEMYRKEQEYQILLEDSKASEEAKQKALFAVTRQRNLYEYGIDIIRDTEKMSKNSNILSKKYYIIIPYYVNNEMGEEEFDKKEIKNMAFSELYTRAQSIIRALGSCSVKGKILNSKELVELLYVAYNRDQEEVYGLDQALLAQYDKLYTTGEDVYKKKIRELDRQIEQAAVEKAKENIDIAKNEIEEEIKEKENNMEELINEMAKIILDGNRNYIEEDVVDKAIENIEKSTKTKEERDEKEKKTRKSSSKK